MNPSIDVSRYYLQQFVSLSPGYGVQGWGAGMSGETDPSTVFNGQGLGCCYVVATSAELGDRARDIDRGDINDACTIDVCKFAQDKGHSVQYWRKRDSSWVTDESLTYDKHPAKYRVLPEHMHEVACAWYNISVQDVRDYQMRELSHFGSPTTAGRAINAAAVPANPALPPHINMGVTVQGIAASARDVADPSGRVGGMGLGHYMDADASVALLLAHQARGGTPLGITSTIDVCRFALAVGKRVQYWRKRTSSWLTTETPTFNKHPCKYRVHPDDALFVANAWYAPGGAQLACAVANADEVAAGANNADVDAIVQEQLNAALAAHVQGSGDTLDGSAAAANSSVRAALDNLQNKLDRMRVVSDATIALQQACEAANLTCRVSISD